MDVFNFCWATLLTESNKSSVFFDQNTCNVKNDIREDFSKPVSRIAYLYKFGSYNISFFHECFKEFFSKVSDSPKIIDDFLSIKSPTICSMSAGPGTDIIGLLYSLHLINKPLINPTIFRVISRHGTWRNVVTEMINSSIISVPDGSTCHLIGCNSLNALTQKAQNYLKLADILLMCDYFPSSVTSPKKICNPLKMIIDLLKPGALVFFIFSKEHTLYFKLLDSFGSFLYCPDEVTLENMPYNEKVAELVGVKPLCSGKSMFAVWQKFHTINPETNVQAKSENSSAVCNDQQSSIKVINSGCEVKDISMSSLKREFSSDTNISFEDRATSSSSSSSSCLSNDKMKRDKPTVSDNFVNFNVHNISSSEKSTNTLKNVPTVSLNTSDPWMRKNFASSSGSCQKKIERNGNDMSSLLKNIESLITKFEGLVSSQHSIKNCHLKEKQFSSCQQNLHQNQYVQPHRCNENTCCCYSMVCCNNVNVCSHNCSSSKISSSCRTQEGPCLVIPLQNLSTESLIQILSIVSQNCSSANNLTPNVLPKEE